MRKKVFVLCVLAMALFPMAAATAQNSLTEKLFSDVAALFLKVDSLASEADKYCDQRQYVLAEKNYGQALKILDKAEACLIGESLPADKKSLARARLEKRRGAIGEKKQIVDKILLVGQLMKQ